MNTKTKLTALVTSTLLTVALAGPANAASPTTDEPLSESVPTNSIPVVASPVSIIFESPAVTTTPADSPTAPVVEVAAQPAAPAKATRIETTPNGFGGIATAIAVADTPASSKGASIAAAAYAQIGVHQDCTMLVTNALRAVGINHHGWPASYAALGTQVSVPQAGDILIYQNAGAGVPHVAIYVGNGKAIHGGFNGSTVLFSANVGSGYAAYRVA
jgi:cell wall-associated NlpC family hydrolase